jgi:Tfp pilus assembly protein PilN
MRFPWQRSEQSLVGLVPAWHPNFRNHEQLPDTKVVRTFFFVNVTAVTVAGCFALLFGYQEYRINNLKHQVAFWQAHNASNRKGAEEAITLSKKFADEERKIHELAAFLKPRMVLSDFLLHLGSTLPPDVVIDSVDVRGDSVDLRGTAAGSPEEASDRTTAYVEQLRQDKYLAGIFESKDVRQDVRRDQSSGHLTFDLSLRFKGEAKKKP